MLVAPRDPYVKPAGAAVGIPNMTSLGTVLDVQDIVELALDLETVECVALVLKFARRRANIDSGHWRDRRRRWNWWLWRCQIVSVIRATQIGGETVVTIIAG